ncbi:MAG TPA: hypothetical protein ENI23_00155 [bacterium]|nr:hypothetical protein [bacterium]
MKILIIHNRKGTPSAKELSSALRKELMGCTVRRGNPDGASIKEGDWDYLINVGSSSLLPKKYKTINPPSAVKLSVNKRLARMRFKAKRIPAPTLWTNLAKIPKKEFPVIGRTSYHMKAKGFWLCKTKKQAVRAKKRGATHFLKFIDNTREFRVHVFSKVFKPKSIKDFKVAKISEKVAIEEENPTSTVIKNHDNGYKFTAPKDPYNPMYSKIKSEAIKAVFEFGLHYGAVDIIFSKSSRKVLVLEINTTPCLTDETANTLDIYSKNIANIVLSKKNDCQRESH